MQYHIAAIPAIGLPELEEELNHFLRSHRVISVQKSMETIHGIAHWCFCVEYMEGNVSNSRGKGLPQGGAKVDYKAILSEEEFILFAKLRELRKQLAAGEAIPVYAVCTNEQLAAMARMRPATIGQLKTIEGLGDAKAGKYGESFITQIHKSEDTK